MWTLAFLKRWAWARYACKRSDSFDVILRSCFAIRLKSINKWNLLKRATGNYLILVQIRWETNRYSPHKRMTMTTMMIMIIIIMIIIAFKGAIRDSFTISSLCRKPSPTRTLEWRGRNRVQITCSTSSVYYGNMSCLVPRGKKGQLSY